MDLDQALRTTGAVRDFSERPVPDEVVHHILNTARLRPERRQPAGLARRSWSKTRRSGVRLRDLYLRGWYEYLAITAAGLVPWAPQTDREAERAALANSTRIAEEAGAGPGGFAEHLDRVPVMLVLLADLHGLAAVDRDLDRYTLVGGASIYPFVWSILLAAHEAGLGGVITTMMVRSEDEVRQPARRPTRLGGGRHPGARLSVRRSPATRLRRRPVDQVSPRSTASTGPPLTV